MVKSCGEVCALYVICELLKTILFIYSTCFVLSAGVFVPEIAGFPYMLCMPLCLSLLFPPCFCSVSIPFSFSLLSYLQFARLSFLSFPPFHLMHALFISSIYISLFLSLSPSSFLCFCLAPVFLHLVFPILYSTSVTPCLYVCLLYASLVYFPSP